MRKADGTIINSPSELLKEWRNYFECLYNVNTTTDEQSNIHAAAEELNIFTGPITLDEVKETVKDLKSNKSPGCDYSITPEALKWRRR